ncbi:MAG: hypothetical protein N3A54_00075 [Patescibacteria group bacterium]|nr:hypothetical protein [Patescibacteria group bacterium]
MSYDPDWENKWLFEIELLRRRAIDAKRRGKDDLAKHYEFIASMKEMKFLVGYYLGLIVKGIVALLGGK